MPRDCASSGRDTHGSIREDRARAAERRAARTCWRACCRQPANEALRSLPTVACCPLRPSAYSPLGSSGGNRESGWPRKPSPLSRRPCCSSRMTSGTTISDKRIVRNPQRSCPCERGLRRPNRMSMAASAIFRLWSADDQIGLMTCSQSRVAGLAATPAVRASLARLGYLRALRDMVAALRDAGLDIAENPTSKKDPAKIQCK